MGAMRNAYKILVRKLSGRDHLENPGMDERMIELLLQKKSWKLWMGFIWLRIETSGGFL
jgi:hypothetical protein